MKIKVYRGLRSPDGCRCWVETYRQDNGVSFMLVDTADLPLRLDLFNHSPDGFNWGYGGSGPAQLALAMLADATGCERVAVSGHQAFKWAFTAKIDQDQWQLDQVSILMGLVSIIETGITSEEALTTAQNYDAWARQQFGKPGDPS